MYQKVTIKEYPPARTLFGDLAEISEQASAMLATVLDEMLLPHTRKNAPVYSLAQIAALCGIEKTRANYIVNHNSDTVPLGSIVRGNRMREFSLLEAQEWIRIFAPHGTKPSGVKGKKIAIGNFKDGAAKTTTTMALAQGLSLRGRRVLLIDLDPQASLTALNGILSDLEVTEEQSVLPLIYGDETSLEYAIQKTYWNGIDLIPASAALFGAEFYLPIQQSKDRKFKFWNIINAGLEPLLDKYDVIILDTPPALSYLTINAFMAADGMIIPIPPNALDFASSCQFWALFSDLAMNMAHQAPELESKTYDFINILMTKTDHTQAPTHIVREWIRKTYKDRVLPSEIPLTAVAQAAAAEFGTVYDISSYSGSLKIYQRAREAYDSFVESIDRQLMALWNSEAEKKDES